MIIKNGITKRTEREEYRVKQMENLYKNDGREDEADEAEEKNCNRKIFTLYRLYIYLYIYSKTGFCI